MSRLNLTSWQRQCLRGQLTDARDAHLYRRTVAVLEFDYGRSAADIARMLGVTRQSVYQSLLKNEVLRTIEHETQTLSQ